MIPSALLFTLLLVSAVDPLGEIGGAGMVAGPLAPVAREDRLIIAHEGDARAVVVVTEDATGVEKHAAAELAHFLGEVTGGEFPIVERADRSSRTPRLLVGPDAAKLAMRSFTTEGLSEEELVIRTRGNDLILAGGRPRGTLYAVYTLLEDVVGCRWWTSSASTIPRKPSLEIGALDIRRVPRFEYRESFWHDTQDGDWAARNRCNGHFARLEARHGGKNAYAGFVHTFFPLIPPDKYFADHPEWFSEIDGKRIHERAQLCLSNEEMRGELVKNLKANLKKDPGVRIASVSQNDWFGTCQCERCAAVDAEEGGPSGSMLHFVNAVAAEIEEEFPQVAISTLAYQYTRQPPLRVRPRPNVIVRLCSIECSFAVPLADERNAAFRSDIVGWSEICDRLYVWDYTTNFAHYVLPHPNLRVLGRNVEFFAEHGVRGVFEQGAYQCPGTEMAALRGWVLAQLLWDPTRDAAALIDEFLDGYYGPAADGIREYLDLTHDAVDEAGDHLGCFSPPTAGFLTFDLVTQGLEILAAAEEAAGDDEALRQRVRVVRLPLLYTFLLRWNEFRDTARSAGVDWPLPDSIETVHDEFLEVATAEKLTRVAEWRALDHLAAIVEQTRSKD